MAPLGISLQRQSCSFSSGPALHNAFDGGAASSGLSAGGHRDAR